MTIRIDPILPEQKPVFIQMMELYLYDFSEFSEDDINESGYFGYPHIDDYWKEEGRHPFFIRADGQLAGLVLVRCCCEHHQMADPHNIAEFFVMKKYRRKGVGRAAAGAKILEQGCRRTYEWKLPYIYDERPECDGIYVCSGSRDQINEMCLRLPAYDWCLIKNQHLF